MSSFTKKINDLKMRYSTSEFRILVPAILFILLCGIVAISFSFCGKNEVDLRSLAPNDTLIYLETNDLGDTLETFTQRDSFKENSQSKMDFSAIKGIKIGVAITGFSTSEKQITQEESILNFKPKFTAFTETNAWSWQVNSLVERNLNDFVKKTYGDKTKLEKKSVNNTTRFIWTSTDDRKAFAVIDGSQVFFGNDEESLNKCLSAKRGERESLLKNENLSSEYEKGKNAFAFGYVSNAAVKKIADLIGVSVAIEKSEDANARGFISRILPQILNNTTREISWFSEKKGKKVEDRVFIKTKKEASDVFSETLVYKKQNQDELYDFVPLNAFSVTRYSPKNPQIAFRSLLLVTAKNVDPVSGKLIAAFSNSLLESYGVSDSESFLSAINSEIVTAQIDEDGDESLAIVKVKDLEKVKKSMSNQIDFTQKPSTEKGVEIWQSEDESLAAFFVKDILVLGDSSSVSKSLEIWQKRKISPIEVEKDVVKSFVLKGLRQSKAVSATVSKDVETAEKLVKILGKPKENRNKTNTYNLTETYFNKNGIERKYTSDFGLLGTIIEQFGDS